MAKRIIRLYRNCQALSEEAAAGDGATADRLDGDQVLVDAALPLRSGPDHCSFALPETNPEAAPPDVAVQ